VKQKKNKKAIKLLYFWIKFILILALLTTIIIFTAMSPLFNIKTIDANGTKRYSNDTLAGLTGIIPGENGFKQIGSSPASIFMFRFGNAEKVLKKECPYIKDVKVKYVIPGRVVIDIVERTAMVTVPYLGTSLIIDNEGYVLEIAPEDKKTELPSLKGLKFKNYELGARLLIENKGSLENAQNVIDAVKQSDKNDAVDFYKKIDSIDISNLQKICISLESRIVVNLGDLQDLNYRVGAAKTIFYKNIKKSEKGILDFSSGENPVFTPESRGKDK
jgi:cell division protein FtsQ